MAITTLITQKEIIDIFPLDDFSVNNISTEQIKKHEFRLANIFLGETFYNEIEATKTATGTFSNTHYQTLYDNYLKLFLSEYITLQVIEQAIIKPENGGFNNNSSDSSKTLYKFKETLNDEVAKSKLMIDSFLIDEANKANFLNYLGNNSNSTTSKSVKRKMFNGFYIGKK